MEDLFDDYENLPTEVQAVIDSFDPSGNTYMACQQLVSDLHPLGYTCDYGLDGEPYGLTKL